MLPNAVPAPQTGAVPRALSGPCRILFLGRVGERKGTPVLLQALAQMRDADWELICAGDGEVSKYKAMAGQLGLEPRVRFLGWVDEDEAQALLAGSDLLVLPSLNEGLPMSIIEAMAHGLPVIATPVGGIPELVTSGKTGLLVPPAEPDTLAEALRHLIEDPQSRRRMGANALAAWREHHLIDAYCRELGTLYEETLQGRVRSRQPGCRGMTGSVAATPWQPRGIVLALCATALTLYLTLNTFALQAIGIHYEADGGNPLIKIHPGTYLIVCAVLVHFLSTAHPLRVLEEVTLECQACASARSAC